MRQFTWAIAVLILFCGSTACLGADNHTVVVQMEQAAPSVTADQAVKTDKKAKPPVRGWSSQPFAGASHGNVLYASGLTRGSSGQVNAVIPQAGHYRVWVRYYLQKPHSSAFYVLINDEAGQCVMFRYCDWASKMPTEHPYEPLKSWAGDKTGWVWEPFDVTFDRPMKIAVSAGSTPTGETYRNISARQIDCLILTTDLAMKPDQFDERALKKIIATPPAKLVIPPAPKGFVWSDGLSWHANDFAGVPEGPDRFKAGLINNASQFVDNAAMVRLGFNHDHTSPSADSVAHGIVTHGYIESYRVRARVLAKEYPSPEGLFVNAKGEVGSTYSLNFKPAIEEANKALVARIKHNLDNPLLNEAISEWRTSVEDGGFLDYSPPAVKAFHAWLEKKHGSIATLNKRWHASYKTFDEIIPPATFVDNPSCWLEFRDFSGDTYVQAVARQIPIVQKLDPKHRACYGANSSLDLLCPYFSVFRPMDFDELLSKAYGGQTNVSWDTYCADDQIACETEMMFSFGDGRKPIIQEWSNHAVDPRIAARSYWSMVSKNVAGINLFMFQEGRGHASYPKWALESHDGSPKPKLAAYSDSVQEVHRLEPIMAKGKYTYPVKPIALYWSRIDLSLDQPNQSLYGTSINSPIHVYSTLRGLGYSVRWITPRQIRNGSLKDVSALVLAGCKYIPDDVTSAVASWVHAGGVIIGDELPGAWNQYAQPQDTLSPIFGVKTYIPKKKAKAAKDSSLAVEESTQGYGEVTDAAVVRKETYTMVAEMAQQPGATHPVAKAVGDFMLSGIGPRRMVCVAGSQIGMTHRGTTGLVINQYGKGKSLYSAIMLGTLYESGGTGYEWDTAHSGLAYRRILGAFLSWAGVPKSCEVEGLNGYVRAKLRVEAPIVTEQGNFMVGMVSFNDAPIGPFKLSMVLPKNAQGPFAGVFAITGGSRELHPLQATVQNGKLQVTVPSFDTHAAIIALQDYGPLVSLELPKIKRGVALLPVIQTDEEFQVITTVYNPSGKTLPAGDVTLTAPAGWLQSSLKGHVGAIAPGGSATRTFTVKAPHFTGMKYLKPLMARYDNGSVQSTPTTEMLWWGDKNHDAK